MNLLAGTAHRNRRLLVRLWVCVLVMFGFSWALIPFYRVLCNLTGLTQISAPGRTVRGGPGGEHAF